MDGWIVQAAFGAILGVNTALLLGILKRTNDSVSNSQCLERREVCPGADLLHHSHETLPPDARVILTKN